jgi:RNA polymerase sigma-70 factor, ECF subfamily
VEASDPVLIERSLNGDLGAFDALMARYQGLVFTVAMTCTRNRDEALDVCQNAFLKAYERLGTLRDRDRFKPWIAQIAHHEGINWVRRHRRVEPLDELELDAWPDGAPDQESRMLADESGAGLSACLGRLNQRYRTAVSLRYFEGMSIAEVAAILRCSEGVVKNMLFRSLRRLKQELMETRQVS